MAFEHTTVLLHETVDGLNVRPDGIYVDATLGGGGHASEVCRRLSGTGRLIGIDQDADAIEAAGRRLEGFGEKVTIIRSNYRDMKPELHKLGIDGVDGITLDLGVSSYQLDTADRGFSYRMDAPLDMRMDQRQKMTARDIINGYSEAELFRVIRDYGEDRFAKNIAKHIVAEREKKPIETTGQLNEIIRHAIPMKIQKTGGHPSKRTFQAIRIELNHELEVLRDSLDEMIDMLDSTVETAEETYADIEGVEYSCEQEDGKLVEKIVIPTDKDTLQTVVEQGLLPVDDENVTQLSLKATTDNLEESGWTIEKAE